MGGEQVVDLGTLFPAHTAGQNDGISARIPRAVMIYQIKLMALRQVTLLFDDSSRCNEPNASVALSGYEIAAGTLR